MERLTDRVRAQKLKDNADKLKAAGFAVSPDHELYIKLAKYEDAEEDLETFRKTHTATLYECDAENNTECKKTACYLYGGECRHTLDKRFAKEGD